jgi:poly(U)-binding-splicing factor PUF60
VGRAITPPDTKNTGPPLYSMQSMPTAAAVAAAAATAKIQAIDAVATNLGLNSDILAAKVCPLQ